MKPLKTTLQLHKIKTLRELRNKCHHCYDYTNKEIKRFNSVRKDIYKKPFHTIIGSDNAYNDIKSLKEKYNIQSRKDSIKSFEVLLQLSKEFYQDLDIFDKEKVKLFVNRSKKYIFEEFGEECVAHMVLHLHETTPHIHCFIVPFKKSCYKGRYIQRDANGNKIYSNVIYSKKYSPQHISKMQDRYYEKFKDKGFSPVEKKTKKGNNRKELKDHYLEVIEENENKNKIFNEKIESLEIKNNILVKELNEAKKELERTKQELSKLQKVIELVKNFFNVDKMKELVEKIRPEKEKEKKSIINYDEVEEKIKTSLKPKPEPASAKFRKKRKF